MGSDACTYTVHDGNSGTATGTVNVSVQPAAPTSMHVSDLDGTATSINRKKWAAGVTVTVIDSTGDPVPGATVQGIWSNGVSSMANTDSTGNVTVSSGNVDKSSSSVLFEVTSITHASLTYDAISNTDPDGDSSGTAIVVYQNGTTASPSSMAVAGATGLTTISGASLANDVGDDADTVVTRMSTLITAESAAQPYTGTSGANGILYMGRTTDRYADVVDLAMADYLSDMLLDPEDDLGGDGIRGDVLIR